jgi:hypothetical protein
VFGDVPAHARIHFIERVARGDERDDPARFHKPEAAREVVVVNGGFEMALFDPRIVNCVVAFCGMTSV